MHMLAKKMGLFAPIFLIIFSSNLFATFIIKDEASLPKKTVDKIEEMGKELKEKTGVNVYLAIYKKIENDNFIDFEKKLSKGLEKPFILLIISLEDKKIDIINSKDLDNRFDKEQILSPFPWSGSILPLLTARSKNPKANLEAALLNGYADIVEQVANSYNIKLESAIGSQNKIVYNIIKILVYGLFLFIILKFLIGRIKSYGKKG